MLATIYRLSRPVTVEFGPTGAERYVVALPAGLRCKPVTPYPMQTRPQFWLDEFPDDIFPPNSMIRHDAEHYGVWLEANDVHCELTTRPKGA